MELWKEAYYDIEIDSKIRDQLIKDYYDELGKKWSNNSDFNIRNLQKCTNFSEEEIRTLQKAFLKDKDKKIVITKEEFLKLISSYYAILK